jgi:hypothetical protein
VERWIAAGKPPDILVGKNKTLLQVAVEDKGIKFPSQNGIYPQ